MPINLPPEAIEAEQRYRAAKSVAERIACLEEFISTLRDEIENKLCDD